MKNKEQYIALIEQAQQLRGVVDSVQDMKLLKRVPFEMSQKTSGIFSNEATIADRLIRKVAIYLGEVEESLVHLSGALDSVEQFAEQLGEIERDY